MKILWKGFPGSTILCPACTWYLAYSISDVSQDRYIQCPNPACREKIRVPLDISYDGEKHE